MSDAGNDGDDGEDVPYLLIHVLPNATGEKPQREIVPADCIKRFQYEVYKTEKNYTKIQNLIIKEHQMAKNISVTFFTLHVSINYTSGTYSVYFQK